MSTHDSKPAMRGQQVECTVLWHQVIPQRGTAIQNESAACTWPFKQLWVRHADSKKKELGDHLLPTSGFALSTLRGRAAGENGHHVTKVDKDTTCAGPLWRSAHT